MIHVCSLAELHPTVAAIGASHIITVLGKVERAVTPASVLDANHLRVSIGREEEMDKFMKVFKEIFPKRGGSTIAG